MRYLFQQGMAVLLAFCLLLTAVDEGLAQGTPTNTEPPQAAQQSPEQLQQLVAPIALYPDALVAQILPAATYPDQVLEAAKWMGQHQGLQGGQLGQEVDKQSWDPSVKALAQFPSVLANMSRNLAWTSELGDAYINQQQELSRAVQTMRNRAKEAGNLNTTPQQKVETKGKTIIIEPAQTDVVYVPQFDPWMAYGAPLAMFPGWYAYPGLYLDGPGIGFGLGFGVGFFGGFGWGWHNWGFDWHHRGRVVYNHNNYVSHSSTIVNRNSFHSGRTNFNSRAGRSIGGNNAFHGAAPSHAVTGIHSGAFSGFSHGGIAHGNSSRGQGSFGGGFHGGVHATGGFHGGGGHR
jgi:hypothetical protein